MPDEGGNKSRFSIPWRILLLAVLLAEVLSAVFNTVMGLIKTGRIPFDVLLIGSVNAFLVSLIVAPILIHFVNLTARLKFEKDFLQKEIDRRRKAEEALARSEENVLQSRRDWADIFDTIDDMITIHDRDFNIIRCNKAAEKMLGLPFLEVGNAKCYKYYHGQERPPDGCPSCQVAKTAIPANSEFFEPHLEAFVEIRAIPRIGADKKPEGVIHIVRDITERKRSEGEIKKQLERLRALRNIDMAIASSLDLRLIMDVVLSPVIELLKADATALLLRSPYSMTLEYSAGKGFKTDRIKHVRLKVGEAYAGVAALRHEKIMIPDISRSSGDYGAKYRYSFAQSHLVQEEGFKAYFGIPLVVKGQVRGVLEVFQRSVFEPGSDWLEFFEALAGQAAIAIDNYLMFDSLQRSRDELVLAYDTTLEGWSKALDYRDKETIGHSQRVTEMTLALSKTFGVSDSELVHIRRGALLHDIGKLGVPDSILFKQDKLSDEEWEVMRRHPEIAYELIAPITFLRPALEIPYSHHEKWDGTGYPRGLRGAQIPLAVRIFSIVDVWDAVQSARPYRDSWTHNQSVEYIRSLAGTHFDPEIVELFLEWIDSNSPRIGNS